MLDIRAAISRLVEVPGLGHVREDLGDPSLRASELPSVRIGRARRIDLADLERFIDGHRIAGRIGRSAEPTPQVEAAQ